MVRRGRSQVAAGKLSSRHMYAKARASQVRSSAVRISPDANQQHNLISATQDSQTCDSLLA
jgi:hypothetical protein